MPGRRACRRRVEAYRGRNEQSTAREPKQGPPDARQTPQHDCEPEECARHEADGRLHPEGGREAGLGQPADRADERVITRGQPPADQDHGRGRRRGNHSQAAHRSRRHRRSEKGRNRHPGVHFTV